jgi:hypothetical protein
MGIAMTADEMSELEKMLEMPAQEPAQEVQAEPAQENVQQASAEPVKAEAVKADATDNKPVEAAEPKNVETAEDFRPVPYTRFKEVNSKLRETQSRAAELEAKLAAFAERETEPADPQSWLDSIINGGDEDQKSTQDVPAWAKAMQSELSQIQSERAQLLLDRTVSQIQKDYPDIPEPVVLQGLANGQTPEDIANAWDYVAKLAIESHAKRSPQGQVTQQAQVKPDVAPRLQPSKGKLNPAEPPAYGKTWADNSRLVQDWWKTQQ